MQNATQLQLLALTCVSDTFDEFAPGIICYSASPCLLLSSLALIIADSICRLSMLKFVILLQLHHHCFVIDCKISSPRAVVLLACLHLRVGVSRAFVASSIPGGYGDCHEEDDHAQDGDQGSI